MFTQTQNRTTAGNFENEQDNTLVTEDQRAEQMGFEGKTTDNESVIASKNSSSTNETALNPLEVNTKNPGIELKKAGTADEYESYVPDDTFKEDFRKELTDAGYDAVQGMEILDAMEKSNDTFRYPDADTMKKEIRYRLTSLKLMNTTVKDIPGFGQWSTDATDYWEVIADKVNPGFKLLKDASTNENKNPSIAIEALVDPTNNLTVDCSTALAVLEVITVKRELGETAFNELYKTKELLIEPLKRQNEHGTKKYRDANLNELTEETTDAKEKKIESYDELIPGDRGHFMNFTTMRGDPWGAEFVLYMGKVDGKHMFRGHPFSEAMSAEELVAELLKEYKRFHKQNPAQVDEIKSQKEWKKNPNPFSINPYETDIVGGEAPGLYKIIERPDVSKLYGLE